MSPLITGLVATFEAPSTRKVSTASTAPSHVAAEAWGSSKDRDHGDRPVLPARVLEGPLCQDLFDPC